jgi:hypothetical protein
MQLSIACDATNIRHACGFYATIFLDGISHTYGFGLLSEDLLRAHTRPDEVACEAYSEAVRLRAKLNGRSCLPVLFDNLIGLRVDLVFFGR